MVHAADIHPDLVRRRDPEDRELVADRGGRSPPEAPVAPIEVSGGRKHVRHGIAVPVHRDSAHALEQEFPVATADGRDPPAAVLRVKTVAGDA